MAKPTSVTHSRLRSDSTTMRGDHLCSVESNPYAPRGNGVRYASPVPLAPDWLGSGNRWEFKAIHVYLTPSRASTKSLGVLNIRLESFNPPLHVGAEERKSTAATTGHNVASVGGHNHTMTTGGRTKCEQILPSVHAGSQSRRPIVVGLIWS